MRLLSVQTMKEMEKAANVAGYSYAAMMRSAGEGIAQFLMKRYAEHEKRFVLGLAGKGNNGGDTLIALTTLQRSGWQTSVLLAAPRDTGDELLNEYNACGGRVVSMEDLAEIRQSAGAGGIVLDGLYGTGFHPPLDKTAVDLLDLVQKEVRGFIWVAVDCPSGVDAQNGEVSPGTKPAQMTICLEAVKAGLMSYAAFQYCGEIISVDLGLAKFSPHLATSNDEVIDQQIVSEMLPERPDISHKGTFGKVMVIGGSVNFPGAPVLAGKGAYAVGSGLVQGAIPGSIFGSSSAASLESTWLILEDAGGVISEIAIHTVFSYLDQIDAIVLGPGIGREATTARFLRSLILDSGSDYRIPAGFPCLEKEAETYTAKQKLPPLVIDADGLYHLSEIRDWYKKVKTNLILTPHPGEMAALTGLSVAEVQMDRIGIARKFATVWGQTVVLKGALTVVADPAGSVAVIPIACSGLAKAGTGDVLAGMIGGLLGQGLKPWQAAVCGAWLHAKAGVAATQMIGCAESVQAGDVIDAIPKVYRLLRANDLP